MVFIRGSKSSGLAGISAVLELQFWLIIKDFKGLFGEDDGTKA
jgi:hypothetical protein